MVASFDAELPEDDRPRLYELVDRHLPCNSCRAVDASATRLRGVRLGRTERLVLLRAAPTTAPKGAIVAPKEHSRGTRESALRAARKLFHRRLLEISHEDIRVAAVRGTQTSRFRVAWRSPLAEEIVLRFRRELESRRIRWDTRLDLGAKTARRDILFLLHALLAELEVAYARRHQLAQLVVAFGDVRAAKTRGQLAVDTHALLVAVRGALRVATGAVAEGPAGELLNEGHGT